MFYIENDTREIDPGSFSFCCYFGFIKDGELWGSIPEKKGWVYEATTDQYAEIASTSLIFYTNIHPMKKKKGLSYDEKREKMLKIFYDTVSFSALSNLSSITKKLRNYL